MIPVPLIDLKFLIEFAGSGVGNFKSAAPGTERKQTLAGLSNPK